jgi:hypothetical protein
MDLLLHCLFRKETKFTTSLNNSGDYNNNSHLIICNTKQNGFFPYIKKKSSAYLETFSAKLQKRRNSTRSPHNIITIMNIKYDLDQICKCSFKQRVCSSNADNYCNEHRWKTDRAAVCEDLTNI